MPWRKAKWKLMEEEKKKKQHRKFGAVFILFYKRSDDQKSTNVDKNKNTEERLTRTPRKG